MDCWNAREILWPLVTPSGREEAERTEAREHLRACAECRQWFRRDERVGHAVRRAGWTGSAPEALRRSIGAALAAGSDAAGDVATGGGAPTGADAGPSRRFRSGAWKGALVRAAAVLLIAVTAVVSEVGPGPADPGTLTRLFVEDFNRHAFEEVHPRLQVTDPGAIRSFFGDELGRAVTPVALPGAEIFGAMICYLQGRPAAMVMYRVDGHLVAHYRMWVGDAREEWSAEDADGLRTERRGEVELAGWVRDGAVHALVSDLPRDRLRRIAAGG